MKLSFYNFVSVGIKSILFRYYFYIAFVAYSLCFLACSYLQIANSVYAYFAFFSTLSVYNLIHVFSSNQLNWKRITLVVVSSLFCLQIFLQFSFDQIALSLVVAFFSILYELPQAVSSRGFRYLPYTKLVNISFCWWSVCLVLPQLEPSLSIHWNYTVFFWCWIVLWCFAFDIRDRESDREKIKTLASVLNKTQVIALLFTLCLIAAWFLYASECNGVLPWSFLLLVFYMNILSYKIENKYFSLVVIDGLPIIWLGLELLFY